MKSVILDIDGIKIQIKEVTPRDAKKIIASIGEIFGDKDLDIATFITDKYDLVIELTKEFIIVDPGHSIDELGFSDIDKIIESFKEVNQSFLGKLVMMGIISPAEAGLPEKVAVEESKTLKEPSQTT